MQGTKYLNIKNIDPATAHLFEHVFIMEFFEFLAQKGIDPSLIGWINGYCFDEVLFLEYGFYDKNILKLFDEYINNCSDFTPELIDGEIKALEVEEKVKITVSDKAGLLEDLNKIKKQSWNSSSPSIKTAQRLNIKASDTKPTKFLVELSLENPDEATKKLFLRAFLFFMDSLHLSLRQQFSAYTISNSVSIIEPKKPNKIYCQIGFIIDPEFYNSAQIKKHAKRVLASLDFKKQKQLIDAHFKLFAEHPMLEQLVIDRYRYSGINISNREIAQLYTPERLKQIQDQLKIHVQKFSRN